MLRTAPTCGPFRVHPLLDHFPIADGDEFDRLVESIEIVGLQVPILLDGEGRVLLHGRARVLAYAAAGRDPARIPRQLLPGNICYEGILDLILTGVLESHHMVGITPPALAILTRPFYAAAAAQRTRITPKVRPHPLPWLGHRPVPHH